jgi:iron complex transport system permease protein
MLRTALKEIAMLGTLASGIVLLDPQALDRYRFWSAGSPAGQSSEVLLWLACANRVG